MILKVVIFSSKYLSYLVKTNVANSRKKSMILKPVIFLSKQTLQIPEKIDDFKSCDFSRENIWVTRKQTLRIPEKN